MAVGQRDGHRRVRAVGAGAEFELGRQRLEVALLVVEAHEVADERGLVHPPQQRLAHQPAPLGHGELGLGDGEQSSQRAWRPVEALEEVFLEDGVHEGAAFGRLHLPDLFGKGALGHLQHPVVEETARALGVGLEAGGRHRGLGGERRHEPEPRRSRRSA